MNLSLALKIKATLPWHFLLTLNGLPVFKLITINKQKIHDGSRRNSISANRSEVIEVKTQAFSPKTQELTAIWWSKRVLPQEIYTSHSVNNCVYYTQILLSKIFTLFLHTYTLQHLMSLLASFSSLQNICSVVKRKARGICVLVHDGPHAEFSLIEFNGFKIKFGVLMSNLAKQWAFSDHDPVNHRIGNILLNEANNTPILNKPWSQNQIPSVLNTL